MGCVGNWEMPAVFKVMLTSLALCAPELKDLLTAGNKYPEAVLHLSAEDSLMDGIFDEDDTVRHLASMSIPPPLGGRWDLGHYYTQ